MSKMANDNGLCQVAAALQKASRLLLLGHVSPDGDSLGSLTALRQILLRQGKAAHIFVAEGCPARYQFLPGSDSIISDLADLPTRLDTVVVLDCGEWDRTGLEAERFQQQLVVNIDHHRTSQGLGHANYLDSDAAATGMLILKLCDYWQVEIDGPVATCLYTAIAGDTGFFQHSNTTAVVHQAAARLLAAGANQALVVENLQSKTPAFLQALNLVLKRLSSFLGGKGAYSFLTAADLQRLGLHRSELEGLVDYPRSLMGVQLAALLVEIEPGKFKVSLRSRAPWDVSAVAATLGGGGHSQAAGCTLLGTLEECIERLTAATVEVVLLQ